MCVLCVCCDVCDGKLKKQKEEKKKRKKEEEEKLKEKKKRTRGKRKERMSGSNNPFYKASENTYQDPLSKASMGSVQVSKEKVDLSDPKLEEAKKAVRDLNSSTNWVAFTYTGTSNVLKVADSGEGGWSQAIDSLNSGKQMFLFLKIKLEETSVPKFVYLTWNPAAVPPMLKGLIHGRSYDIGKWIGQFHLQIDAQSETDLDEDKMIEKLKRSANK